MNGVFHLRPGRETEVDASSGSYRGQTQIMDLTYPTDAEEFRSEIRSWLETNLPSGWFDPGFEMSDEERREFNAHWPANLFSGGWICATWPTEYGGKGLSTMQGVVLAEEFARARAPMRGDFFGDTLVGPTLLQWGTEEQKREFLPGILKGETRWCQGFSEPNSGSDLASLKTTAVLDGDEWVINGQKVWTTQGHHADYCFLLTRTDQAAPKHAGISYLLVPMRQDGVEVRGITQPDGTAEFCEVFFTDARCPADNVVGGVNNGWAVAMTLLGFERGEAAATAPIRFQAEVDRLGLLARERGLDRDPVIRQRIAQAYSKVQVMRYSGMRVLTNFLRGHHPGPDGAISKLYWSEYHRTVTELATHILGADAMVPTGRMPSSSFQTDDAGAPNSSASWVGTFLSSRAGTIYAGSSQIQRNIIGEMVLGLPKEPRPA